MQMLKKVPLRFKIMGLTFLPIILLYPIFFPSISKELQN